MPDHTRRRRLVVAAALAVLSAAAGCRSTPLPATLTFSGSVVGREAEVLRAQVARFEAAHEPLRVRLRPTPDAADERRRLYVQWLNARVPEPDVLQLDVIWTPEFAAAGWILALDRFAAPVEEFFPAAIAANRWQGSLYALPWFVDVGMLYWRTDLVPAAPVDFGELVAAATAARAGGVPFGFVWQGARYEGLVTVFLEHLGGFGGRLMDEHGAVTVDSDAAAHALTFMRDAIWGSGVSPPAVLGWQEEQVRFAFQNGQAAFMRNWPYAQALLNDGASSAVAGRFDIAPMPAAAAGAPTAALGGSHLAINARSALPEEAYALVSYLTAPGQMLERARVAGQLPARPALFRDPSLSTALGVDAQSVLRIVEAAVPRPVTPIYSQLSEILQVHLHRALTRQREPRQALGDAAAEMRRAIERAGLAPARSAP
jgi:multiple sugar transport system substrate-binding protein